MNDFGFRQGSGGGRVYSRDDGELQYFRNDGIGVGTRCRSIPFIPDNSCCRSSTCCAKAKMVMLQVVVLFMVCVTIAAMFYRHALGGAKDGRENGLLLRNFC